MYDCFEEAHTHTHIFTTFFLIFTYDLVCPKEIIFHRWTHKWSLLCIQTHPHIRVIRHSLLHVNLMGKWAENARILLLFSWYPISICCTHTRNSHSPLLYLVHSLTLNSGCLFSRMREHTNILSFEQKEAQRYIKLERISYFVCIACRHLKSIFRFRPEKELNRIEPQKKAISN